MRGFSPGSIDETEDVVHLLPGKVSSRLGRRVSVAAITTLVALALGLNLPRAFAAPAVAASSVDAGQATSITVNGCADSTRYSGATFEIAGSDGEVVDQGAVPDWTFTWSTDTPDLYTVTVTCLGYNSVDDASAATTFAMWPTFIDISPDTWVLGQSVTLQAVGFTPGEDVKLRLTSDATGEVIQSWSTTSTVDDSALWNFEVVLPGDLGEGVYYLVATGVRSGTVRTGGFGIVSDGTSVPTPTTPPTSGGLPDTGASVNR